MAQTVNVIVPVEDRERSSETSNGAVSTYAYPSTANALSSITLGGAARSFAYDAAGNAL